MEDRWNINYDEAKVREYSLPPILRFRDDRTVDNVEQWRKRRQEILELFRTHVYGQSLPVMPASFSVIESADGVLDGLANRRQIRITVQTEGEPLEVNLLLYLPAAKRSSAVFLGLNFFGNQTICDDPAVPVTRNWIRDAGHSWCVDSRATELSRGAFSHRWQVEKVLGSGCGLATVYYGDICPDYRDGFDQRLAQIGLCVSPTNRDVSGIGLWAWGLMRIMDVLTDLGEIDSNKVVVMGHSRLGKSALWAGAQDERFAAVISNDSGCGGASLSRRNYGENLDAITSAVGYWFCSKFKEYVNNEDALPVDQHMLLALMAPRPLLVASAADDKWADPKGEFLSALHASEAYGLFGDESLRSQAMPELCTFTGDRICYHIRSGEHDVTAEDWNAFLRIAEKACGNSSL